MKNNLGICGSWCLWFSLAGIAAMPPATAAKAETIQYPIVSDVQLDSQSPTLNFGVSATAKAVVNGQDGSLAHAVFQIPSEVWNTPLESIVSAKVCFYAWKDQTLGRNVRLHPLARGFAEGTGNGAATGDGATWLSYDGTNLWDTAGGDYESGVWAEALKPSEGFGWFSWDISGASLWNNSNLRSFGAILKMGDESDPGYPNMPRAPFSSHESTSYPHPYVEITTGAVAVPEPATAAMLLAGGLLVAGVGFRRRHLPAVSR
jgi:hypothetical protein